MSSDYRNEVNRAVSDGSWTLWKVLWRVVLVVIVLSAVGYGVEWMFTPAALVSKVANPDKIISNYEEFQEVYNSCLKLDSDLQTICDTPDSDAMFSQFSKGAIVAAKRQQMTRWVNDYNAKSKMITRSYWKSASLPYQINLTDFQNYNCNEKH